MALDTRNKRGSALGIDFPWLHIYPNPDGVITGALDRQQIAYKYAGIQASGAPVITFIPRLTLMGAG